MLDGVQNLMNVNSATFSGAVDILVVPQEDGTFACTSWHVRFGKLQLLNTSEKKIHVKVNDKEVKGMKMRIGRAGEAYFIAETSQKPPPEFQASIDPEHGLSDEESYDLAPRAVHDDWAVQDDKHNQVVEMEVDPPVEANYSAPPVPSSEDSAHERHKSGDQIRVNDAEGKKSLRNSSSAHSVLSSHDSQATLSTSISPSSKPQSSIKQLAEAKRTQKETKKSDGLGSSSNASDSEEVSARDRLNSSDPILQATSIVETSKLASSATPASASSKASKSWGLSLFGFLGKKDQVEDEEMALGESKATSNSIATSALSVSTGNRRTSLDMTEAQKRLDGDVIYLAPERSDPKTIQSSSLPNHWGPSPILLHGTSASSVKSTEEDYLSDGGGRPVVLADEERSRAADDGSGVIFVGQKRKPRSSSITSSSLGKIRSNSPTPPTGPLDATTSSMAHSASKTSIQPSSQSNAYGNSTGFAAPSKSPDFVGMEGQESISKSSERIRQPASASASSPDSDGEYQDMVFEMDEEAYQAANPLLTAGSLTEALEGSRSPPPTRRTMEMSKCGMNAVANAESNPTAAMEAFNANKVTWQALNEDPNLLFSPEVVFRIGGSYYPFIVAAPMLFSVSLFNSPLSSAAIEKMIIQSKPKSSKWTRWFGWSKQEGTSSTSAGEKRDKPFASPGPRASSSAVAIGESKEARGSVSSLGGSSRHSDGNDSSDEASYVNAIGVVSPRNHRARAGSKLLKASMMASSSGQNQGQVEMSGEASGLKENGVTSPSSMPSASGSSSVSGASPVNGQVYYIRALKPSSDKLKALNLKPGANKVVFSVNSRLQGMQEVSSTIYLWDRDCKIVISDIDGTITKSDVLGQLFPVFGKDWSHSGVAALFQSIKSNGYEILYLTARAIGAASFTKGFLTSLQQDSVHLPDGPVFMSPDRLLHSLNREVILRRPEEFKIQCLTEIKSLFTGGPQKSGSNPFYAGFGNRETDALSYVAVGIPVGKTFTINPSGEITGHSRSIQRTYTTIHGLAEQMFPPYHKKTTSQRKPAEQWNDFQFWETRPSGYSLEEIEKELLR